MKDRAMRRHEDLKAKIKSQHNYTSCIEDLPESERLGLENNIEKLKKVCVASHLDDESKKDRKKTRQEIKHDISMKEQLDSTE